MTGRCDPHERPPLRVLVVEDEALIAMALEDMLEDLGVVVVAVAADVANALAALDRHRDGLDGAVLDANLGGDSARPVADALRARGAPYLLASGYGDDELRRLGFDAPAVRKPYSPEKLREALAALRPRAPATEVSR